jgi:hypothetical protein
MRPYTEQDIQGVQSTVGHHTSAVMQLLFARPRLPKPPAPDRYGNLPPKPVLTPDQVLNLCLMRLEFYEVKRWEEVITPAQSAVNDAHRSARSSNSLKPIDKELAKLKGTSVGSECGAVISADTSKASSSRGARSPQGSYTASYYSLRTEAKLGEISIRYRQRHDLFMWGFFATKREPGAEDDDEIAEVQSPQKKIKMG